MKSSQCWDHFFRFFFPNHYCQWPFLAGENLKVASDIAGRWHLSTTLNATVQIINS